MANVQIIYFISIVLVSEGKKLQRICVTNHKISLSWSPNYHFIWIKVVITIEGSELIEKTITLIKLSRKFLTDYVTSELSGRIQDNIASLFFHLCSKNKSQS
jgi:hypothetical protein